MQRNFIDVEEADLQNVSCIGLELLIEQSRVSQEELINENLLLERYLQTFESKRKYLTSEESLFEPTDVAYHEQSISDFTKKFAPALTVPDRDKRFMRPDTTASTELSESMSLLATLTEDSASVTSHVKKQLQLPFDEKCEIASQQIRELTEKITKLHNNWFRKISPFKVKLEEVTIRDRELHQDISDFQRDVIHDGINPATGNVLLEKVLLYFNRSTKYKEIQIERSRLEFFYLKNLESKLIRESKQKQAMGSSLGDVDYKELRIENAQYIEKVEDKNQVLMVVKRHMNITLQLLRQYKVKLQQLTAQDENLRLQIQLQKDNMANIEREIETSSTVKHKMKRQVHHLRYQLENYRVPDVMDYVNIQAEIFDLRKLINVWQRRLKIAEHSYNAKFKLYKGGSKLIPQVFY